MFSKIKSSIMRFLDRMGSDNISAFSAQAAFFMIMSVVPFLSLLLTLVKYLPISSIVLKDTVANFFPTILQPLASTILDEVFEKTNGAVLSVSVFVAVWSSAKGVMAIINGLKSVYHVENKKNYFFVRFISSIYTIVFVVAIIATLLLIVFGNTIYMASYQDFPKLASFISIFVKQKYALTFCVLTLFFLFVYQLVRPDNYNFVLLIPGAVFSAVIWIAFSDIFSIYITKFSDFSYMYGSLATIILLMLWLYICMYILFIGAEINEEIKHLTNLYEEHKKNKE